VVNNAFLLHMSSDWKLAREALSWLNEAPEEFGSFWKFAQKVTG
jgi:hypothetical protein